MNLVFAGAVATLGGGKPGGGGSGGVAPSFVGTPTLSGNTNGAGAHAADTLTVNYSIDPSTLPLPTILFDWESVVHGNVGSLSTMNCGGFAGDKLFCTVTAFNSAGSASATTAQIAVSQ